MSELDRASALADVKTGKSYLFYGVGGTGKTRLALKHPAKKKFIIDVDEKAHELLPLLTPAERDSVTVWSPNVPLHMDIDVLVSVVDPKRRDVTAGTVLKNEPLGYKRVVTVVNELLKLAHEGKYPYEVTILDSLTKLVNHLTYSIMYHHRVSNMTQTLFEVVGRNLRELLSKFLNLPGDRIIIAHEIHQEKRDEQTQALIWEKIRPHVHGSSAVREELNTMVSETWRFLGRNVQGKYQIQTASSRLAPARTTKQLDFEQEIDAVKLFA